MKGLSLFEVLVAILIFSIIAMGLGSAIVAAKNALFVSDIPTQLRQNLLFALFNMAHELRQSAPSKINITEGVSAAAITFKKPQDDDIPADGVVVDSIGNIEWGPEITYARDGANQLIRTSGVSSLVIAPNITALQFSRPTGEDALIQIDITAQKADGQGAVYQDTEQMLIKMRN